MHKFGAKTQFLMPLMSWYHSFMEDARIRRGCRGYVRVAVVLIPETTANKTTLLATSTQLYINKHSTQTLAHKVLCTCLPEARIMQRKRNPGMFLLDKSTRGFVCCGSQCGRAPFDPAASSATARLRTRQKERLRLENDYRARWRCKLRNTEAVTIQARRIEPFEGRISVADEALDGY